MTAVSHGGFGGKGEALRRSRHLAAAASPSPLCRSKWDKHLQVWTARSSGLTPVAAGHLPHSTQNMTLVLLWCQVVLTTALRRLTADLAQTWDLEHEVISTCRSEWASRALAVALRPPLATTLAGSGWWETSGSGLAKMAANLATWRARGPHGHC